MGDFYILGLPVSLGTMIYQAVIFTILVFMIKRWILPKLLQVMEKRRQHIENQLLLAETYKKDAEQDRQLQEKLKAQAKLEALELVRNGQMKAEVIIRNAKEEAAKIRSQARDDERKIRERGKNEKIIR